MSHEGNTRLTYRELISAWWAGAWDGRRRQLVLPEAGAPEIDPPWTPAIQDRYDRADVASKRIFQELHAINRDLVQRVHREAMAVIHENDALEKLTPATVGRFIQALGEWHWVVRDGCSRAQVAVAKDDLWIGRYWRALSANHKGLRRRRPRHLEGWAPSRTAAHFTIAWDRPNQLLGGSSGDYLTDKNGDYLKRALDIVSDQESPDEETGEQKQ